MSLDGLGLLVADGATGAGEAVALAAAERGARVLLSVKDASREAATRVLADPCLERDAEHLFGAAVARLPRVDRVVFVAPEMPTRALADISLEEWEAQAARALRGAFFVSRLAVEEFLAHGASGRLVHVVADAAPGPGQALAAATLESLLSLMRSTAKEYGPRGICCNAVVHSGGDLRAIAEATLFLASAEASFINGETVRVG